MNPEMTVSTNAVTLSASLVFDHIALWSRFDKVANEVVYAVRDTKANHFLVLGSGLDDTLKIFEMMCGMVSPDRYNRNEHKHVIDQFYAFCVLMNHAYCRPVFSESLVSPE